MAPKTPPADSTIRLSLDRLIKESKKSNGNLDKVKRAPVFKTPRVQIKSPSLLKRNCSRLIGHLHQKMFHTVAVKVSEVNQHIRSNMPAHTINHVIDVLEQISDKYGFDFFKP